MLGTCWWVRVANTTGQIATREETGMAGLVGGDAARYAGAHAAVSATAAN